MRARRTGQGRETTTTIRAAARPPAGTYLLDELRKVM